MNRPWLPLVLTTSLRVLVCVLLCAAAPLQALQAMSLADADARGQTIFEQLGVTGMSLVVVRNQETLIRGYGESAPGSHRAPDAASEIRLCSLTKVMTADLLARTAADGTVKLTDPLQLYAPAGVVVPKGPEDSPITLRDLATHTSGLAREVAAYPRHTPHFTFPNFATRWDWLPKQTLPDAPGSLASYSNVGFDLLGDSLAHAARTSYARLLHERLLAPLNMWDTTLVPSREQCDRLLEPLKDQGPCTDTQPSGPSGGVYSTPADMAKFLAYLLQLPGSIAQPPGAFAIQFTPAQLKSMNGLSHAGDPTGIGLAWIQLGDPATPSVLLQKTGGGAGFTTYIALSLKTHTAIFVAVTDGKGRSQIDFFHECNNLLAALANVPPLPLRLRHAAHRRPAAHNAAPRESTRRPAPHGGMHGTPHGPAARKRLPHKPPARTGATKPAA
jgi:D-alanyl-D-alanine-carboxypeptidase/D-alanyl-D-alanine-endopeptidase